MQIAKPNISEHRNVNFNLKLFKIFLGTQQQHIWEDSNTGAVWCIRQLARAEGTLNYVFLLYVLQLDVDPCSRITNYFVHNFRLS